MNIGKSIRVACAQNDINQQELSDITNISEVTISKLVNGKSQCKQTTLETLAEAFKMPVSGFIALGE